MRPAFLPSLKVLFIAGLFALQSILFSACGTDDSQQVQKTKHSVKKKRVKKKRVEKKKVVENQTKVIEYTYDSTGKPDPFVPLITEIEPQRKKPELQTEKIPLTPLQKYEIDDLKLVAIIKAGKSFAALFEDMSEFGYVVRENTLIGKNGGMIKKITDDSVIIEENIYNATGEIEKNIRSIKIQHQE